MRRTQSSTSFAYIGAEDGVSGSLFHEAGRVPDTLSIVRPVSILSSGNHHPLVCEMWSESGAAGIWVVKPSIVLSRSTDRSTFGVLAELAGAEVCSWAGILAPRVALTRFPNPLDERALLDGLPMLEKVQRSEVLEVFRANKGRLAFCARYLAGATDLRTKYFRLKRWRAIAIPDAVALLVADAYMRHDDRLEENPNAVWFSNRVVALDHGSAFALMQRTGTSGDDLAAHTALHARFDSHVAISAARKYGEDVHWDVVAARLEAITPPQVAELLLKWPPELDDDALCSQHALRSRMVRFLGHRGGHVRELVRVLREAVARGA